MSSFFSIFVEVCLPILLLIGLGWGLDRIFDLDLKSLVKLNIYLFVPAFILVKLSTSVLEAEIGLLVIGFTLIIILTMAALSWLTCRIQKQDLPTQASLQLSTMFYNSGNWAIPLMALAFSELGPVVQLFVLTTMNFSGFTLGVFLANAGNESRRGWFVPVLKQPSVYAVILALTLRGFGNPLTEVTPIWVPLEYLADGLIPLALVTLGVQLSKTRPPRPQGNLIWALVIRLIGGPATAIALTWLFQLSGEMAAILIVGAASPSAVNTALLAHEFKADSRFAAAAVLYSTLLASIVVTLLLALLRAGVVPWAAH
ncbi:MAG: AEC family transporter [Verrucomicrobiota bacterium]